MRAKYCAYAPQAIPSVAFSDPKQVGVQLTRADPARAFLTRLWGMAGDLAAERGQQAERSFKAPDPLRRIHGRVEKGDLLRRGFGVGAGDSELVDPVVQRERCEARALLAAAGDDEGMRVDEDFLTAMEYAMPPSGGMGMGIDRLLMALTGLGIRETILFPLVKPQN